MMQIKRMFGAVCAVLFACALLGGAAASADTNVMFIVDASGSMKKPVEGGDSRMAVAKQVLAKALAGMPSETRLGLVLYGHRKAKDCTDIELTSPIGAEDAAALSTRIQALKPKGETPIAASLELAAKSFIAFKGQSNSIVLVTDGIEECKGDPCAAAKAIKDSGVDLKVNVVGFTLKDEQKELIKCVADETGGTYYDAKNAAGLSAALAAVSKAVVAQPDDNLLAQASGGTLLAAPNDEWLKLNDGKEEQATVYAGEGVWAFKGGKPATFDSFDMLIPETSPYNVKDFELWAGDEGPTGTFRSIGSFAAQNIKMMQAPYQAFKFPPVTAKFLKVVLKTDAGGGYIDGYEFRLHGKLDASAAPVAPAAAAANGIDLLSQANGATLLAAPNDEWKKLNDGSTESATVYAGEGVWSFKDGKPASFDRFEILVPGSSPYNVKDFELFAGDEGPTGAFRSIGQFTTTNLKLMQSPFQVFTFPSVTATYLKVELKTDWGGGYIATNEFHLFGTPDAVPPAGSSDDASSGDASVPAAASATDLLSSANGGQLVTAPNDDWKKLTDGSEDQATPYAGEGIWSFKGDAPATFDAFEMLIPAASPYNVKDFELLVGDDGPGGAFRSLGEFSTQNAKMMQSPYQRFSFPPVTAKYLKVVLKTDWGGGYISAYEFHLLGQAVP